MPAFYIVLQESIPGVDAIGLEGRALSKYSTRLEALAKQAGVRSLFDFFSANPKELAGFLEDHPEKETVTIPEERWFLAEEGLKTISALLKSLVEVPPAATSKVAKELKQFQHVLEVARSRHIRWHLGIDY
jgi:hypothetical protein